MIRQNPVRLAYKPGLNFPYVIQVERPGGRWVALDSYGRRDLAEKCLTRLKKAGHPIRNPIGF